MAISQKCEDLIDKEKCEDDSDCMRVRSLAFQKSKAMQIILFSRPQGGLQMAIAL